MEIRTKKNSYYLTGSRWYREHIPYKDPPIKYYLAYKDWALILSTITNVLLTFKILCLTS